MTVHPNAIKIVNPTSQCALLGLKLVQLSTLAGRIFFLSPGKKFGRSGDGLYTEYIWSEGAYKLRISSVRTPSEFCPPWQKKYPTSQCAQLNQFQAQKSTLAGRISYFSGILGYRGCNNPGDLGRGVLVSPKCCKFKVFEGIGWCIGIYCGNIYIVGPLFQERMRKKGKIRRK